MSCRLRDNTPTPLSAKQALINARRYSNRLRDNGLPPLWIDGGVLISLGVLTNRSTLWG